MKQIKFVLLAVAFVAQSSFAQAQTAVSPVKTAKKKVVTTTTTTTTEEVEPAATPVPMPEPEEKTTGEKIKDAAEKASDGIQDAAKQVGEQLGATAARRADSDAVIMATYSPLDLVLPSKIGASIGLIQGPRNTLELEYLKGSIKPPLIEDLGEVSDTRITLMRRSYFASNSFNFSYGISYMGFTGKVGDALLSRLSGGAVPSIDLIEVNSFGTYIGFGNRWIFARGITFGVDWFGWTQPLLVTKREAKFLDYVTNQDDKDKMDTAVKILSYLPRFSALKLQLGMTF